ncbi:Scr1 family TA system antitoxin-like transcriptional regulator [Streptomyces sp. bgisy126]|uniref:Scr1 family TA system antitoxin-like transcriptional regulator n=1 Tax=unclassified Streptomyces TaxID=2593676 RepID=UPI003EC004AD
MDDLDGVIHTDDTPAPPPAYDNIRRPWLPRVYDFLTGGSECYAADAEFGRRVAETVPWLQASMWINKRHRTKGALVLAEELGIRRFIDLDCGYPSYYGTTGGCRSGKGREYIPPHTFDVVRSVHEDVRLVCADVDPYVFGHAKTVLDEDHRTRAMQVDARDIPALLSSYEIVDFLDLDRPIGVLLHDVLTCLDDNEAALVLPYLHDLLPAGSAVSLTHATGDHDVETMTALVAEYAEAGTDYRPRSLGQIRELLSPWDLLDPGLQPTTQWREGQPPHIPPYLRTTLRLPADASHAYAAVTTPKTIAPEPITATGLLSKEPARAPGLLLVGTALEALREKKGICRETLAKNMTRSSLAVELWEAGSHRLVDHVYEILYGLDLDDYDSRLILERLLPTEKRPWDKEYFGDYYARNMDRAFALLRAATRVRAFTVGRLPDAFHTPAYASLFPVDDLIEAPPGQLPSIVTPRAEDADSCTWDLVLDEAVLRRPYGHPRYLGGQFNRLLYLDALPHITVCVLAYDSPYSMPVAGLAEYTLPGGTLWRSDGFTYSGLDKGECFRLLIDRAVEHAEPEAESRAMLEAARERMDELDRRGLARDPSWDEPDE